MNFKKYIGNQLRPSQLAAELLPREEAWCKVCHQTVLRKNMADHNRSLAHRLGVRKANKMKNLSLRMWEKHRGAPLDQENANDAMIEAEFKTFRQDQKRREQLQMEQQWFSQQRFD